MYMSMASARVHLAGYGEVMNADPLPEGGPLTTLGCTLLQSDRECKGGSVSRARLYG